jgi:hypothetical protein
LHLLILDGYEDCLCWGLRSLMLYILSSQTQKRAFFGVCKPPNSELCILLKASSAMPYRTRNHYRNGPSFHTMLQLSIQAFSSNTDGSDFPSLNHAFSSQGSSYGGTHITFRNSWLIVKYGFLLHIHLTRETPNSYSSVIVKTPLPLNTQNCPWSPPSPYP